MDKPCFELKGSLFTLSVLQLFDNNLALLETQLQERIKMAPGFFNHTPFVIDLHELLEAKQNLDFLALHKLLTSLSIIPVGVKGADKSLYIKLEAAGMAVLAEAKTPRKKRQEQQVKKQETDHKTKIDNVPASAPQQEQEKAASKADEPVAATNPMKSPGNNIAKKATKIVRQTVRSGQQIYAPGGDLVVIGSVSAGAEILADGNIHIYGTLRGRALAGVQGNQGASIFCRSLQAELISIAGIYLLSDNILEDKIGTSVQIYLQDEKLQMESI